MSDDPNETQIGGSHYKGREFQPWDWATEKFCKVKLGYFETSAIAYLVRFREKGGLQDLNKVLHYIDKIIWAHDHGHYGNRCQVENLTIFRFNRENNCDALQSETVRFLVTWRAPQELMEARKLVVELIELEKDHQWELAIGQANARGEELIRPIEKPEAHSVAAQEEQQLKDMTEDGSWMEIPKPPSLTQRLYTTEEVNAILAAAAAKKEPEPPPKFRPLPPVKFPKQWDREDGTFIKTE